MALTLYYKTIKDDVHSCAHARTLLTFWTAIFVKYDILTEYLTLFWFATLVNEHKLYVSIQKSSKDAKFGQCLYVGSPFVMSRTELTSPLNYSLSSYTSWQPKIQIIECLHLIHTTNLCLSTQYLIKFYPIL
jgi:hypothetical protein